MSAPPLPPDPNAVRVVFFGPPRSGKTSLLYAAARYAERGAEDDTVTLSAADPHAVRRELVPLRLLVDLPGPRTETGAVLFIDCDGQAVREFLSDTDQLKRTTARTALADAVRSADALVLVVDAEWSDAEVQETFAGFEQFLTVLESTRSDDREVGGLPVFLTLTKCDALYQTGAEPTDWLTRVEGRMREVRKRFDEWFDDAGSADPFLAFGSTEVRVAATATQVPRVVGPLAYADDAGGLGVVDFVQSVLTAARDHRDRAVRSRKRLGWTAGLAVGLMATVLVGMIGLTVNRPAGPVELLTSRTTRLQSRMGPPEVRLAEANFDRNRQELAALREAAAFERLPEELKAFVTERELEFAAYAEYRRRFQPPQFAPADVQTRADYEGLRAELEHSLAPPPGYADAWVRTEAVKLREKWRTDLDLLRDAEDQVHAWFRGQVSRAGELLLANVPTEVAPARWRADVTETLGQRPPFGEDAPVPGSPVVPVHRGAALTYAAAYQFERSANARRDWEQVVAKLADLRDAADAVGLTGNPDYAPPPGEPTAVLDLPPPGNGTDSFGLAVSRLEVLRKRFPKAADGSANWAAANFQGPLREEIGRRLRVAAADGVGHVQRLIRTELNLNGRADTPADWAKLAAPTGLLAKSELQAWGRLLRLLLRWADPTRPDIDPVAELAAFVRKERFEWAVNRLDVTLPNALRVRVLKPDGELKVTSGRREYRFENGPSPETTADAATHRFRPKGDTGPLTFTPGDGFEAELTLTDGDAKYLLKWTDARTAAYPFDKLTREPTVESVGPGGVPQRATGVRVKVFPEATGFGVPELLPDVK